MLDRLVGRQEVEELHCRLDKFEKHLLVNLYLKILEDDLPGRFGIAGAGRPPAGGGGGPRPPAPLCGP